jgi:hypothetical protein
MAASVAYGQPEAPEVRRARYLARAQQLRAQALAAKTDTARHDFIRIALLYELIAEGLARPRPQSHQQQ